MSTTKTNSDKNQPSYASNSSGPKISKKRSSYQPRFDIWEGDEELILYGDLPGVNIDQLDIQFEQNTLTIHGNVSEDDAPDEYVYREYGLGDFKRTFTIGESINVGEISAELRHGVLSLHLPKSEKVKPRRIEVKAS